MYIIYIIPMKISTMFLSHGEFQARPQAARAFRSQLSRADAEARAMAKSPGHGGLNGKILGKPIGKPIESRKIIGNMGHGTGMNRTCPCKNGLVGQIIEVNGRLPEVLLSTVRKPGKVL